MKWLRLIPYAVFVGYVSAAAAALVVLLALRSDGGDVELIDFDEEDGVVQLRLMGACGSCPVSMLTLKRGIEQRLVAAIPEVREIQAL